MKATKGMRKPKSQRGSFAGLIAFGILPAVLFPVLAPTASATENQSHSPWAAINERYARLRQVEIDGFLAKFKRGERLSENESGQAIRYLIEKGLREIREQRAASTDGPLTFLSLKAGADKPQ